MLAAVKRLRAFASRTFRSLESRNYRVYFIGQAVSVSGDWMQTVGQMWLVLELTHSGTALGVTTALQTLPVLIAGAWGGVLSDRLDKRHLLLATQVIKGGLAVLLGAATTAGVVKLWMVYAFAFLFGSVNAIDNPARRAFVSEMAGQEELANAVSLYSALQTSARTVGPAIAGVLIATVGIAACFYANAASFVAVIVALAIMRTSELHRSEPAERARGQVREGLRYAISTPEIRFPLIMMAVIGTMAYNFRVILPLIAQQAFHGGAGLFGTLYSVMSIGSVAGALYTASRLSVSARYMVFAAFAFGLVILGAAAAPTLVLEGLALIALGAVSAAYTSTTQAVLQLSSSPSVRGRVMALYSVVFLGSTPIGGPIVGWIAERFGVRTGFAVGGVVTVVTALLAVPVVRRIGRTRAAKAAAGAEAATGDVEPAGAVV
jgi:MFS family permease